MFSNPNLLISKGIGFLGWFTYVPVLLLIKRSSFKNVWIYGIFYGAISYFLFAYWLISYNLIFIFLVCISYAIIMAVLFLLIKLADKVFIINGWILQWAIICLYEYVKTLGFAGHNYGIIAYTQWRYSALIQICDVIGVFGLNAVMIGFSVSVYAFIQKKVERKEVVKSLQFGREKGKIRSHINYATQKNKILKNTSVKNPLICFGIVSACTIGFLIYGINTNLKIEKADFNKITVAAIQSNDNSQESGTEQYGLQVHKLIRLTEEAREYNPNIKLVVWPETAVIPAIVYNYNTKKDLMRYTVVKTVLEYIDLSDITFVVGNGHYGEREGKYHKRYNSALVFEGKKNTIPPEPEVYVKQHLVPFSEYFPLEDYFPELKNLFLNGEQAFWTPGTEATVFNSQGLSFSTPICFEDTFTTIARDMYKKGARCFINLTNDSWSQSKACQNQHLAMAVFRSVENKVPSVRSATSGETCIIYPDGKIISHAPSFCESYVIGDIPVIPETRKPTVYTQYGDFMGWGMIFVIGVLLLIKLFTVIIKAIKLRINYR